MREERTFKYSCVGAKSPRTTALIDRRAIDQQPLDGGAPGRRDGGNDGQRGLVARLLALQPFLQIVVDPQLVAEGARMPAAIRA